MRSTTTLAVLALLSATLVSPLVGQEDDESARKTLAGLTRIYVVVEHIPDEAQRDGLDTTQIRTDVELKLRQAGITVLAGTWSATGTIATVGSHKLASLRDNVRDLTDQFINAYLAANPKR